MTGAFVVGGVVVVLLLPQPEANAVIAVAIATIFSVVLKFVFIRSP
jgi:hypothetical protein